MKLDTGDPQHLGEYELTRRLGSGEHGTVYLGHTAQGAQVAVKLLSGGPLARGRDRTRFLEAAAAARKVVSANTGQLLEAGVCDGRPYVVSEFVAGTPLERIVADRGPLAGERLRRLALRTAMALAEIHRSGAIHGAVKPANVMLGPAGIKLIDFDVADLPDASAREAGYVAPERRRGEPPGPAADVFSWATTVVYAATGRPPSPDGPLPAGGLGDEHAAPTADLIAACLAADPRRRPSPAEIVRELRRPSRPAPEPSPVRARALVAGLFVVVALGFLVGLGVPIHF